MVARTQRAHRGLPLGVEARTLETPLGPSEVRQCNFVILTLPRFDDPQALCAPQPGRQLSVRILQPLRGGSVAK